jgi:hypothetical protein
VNTYQIDTLVQLQTTFTSADGVTLVDPETVTLYAQTPDGVVAEYTPNRVSVGLYQYAIRVNQFGPWVYKWQGAGVVEVTSADVYFVVAESVLIDA